MKAEILTLEGLARLRDERVQLLLKQLALHWRPLMTSPAGPGRQAWLFVDSTGRTDPKSLRGSALPPLYGVTPEGLLYNGYGNAAIRPWTEVGIEDVLRVAELVHERLAALEPA